MKSISNLWCGTFLIVSACVSTLVPTSTRADVIIDWNMKADEIAAQKQVLPFNHARGVAMLQVAMFEAVNAIERRYTPYKVSLTADRGTSKEAAAAYAGHDVLLALYPDRKADLDATLAAMLVGVVEGEPKQKGIDLGKKAAAEIIALRANDGIDAQEIYRPHTTPGIYVPTVVPVFSTVGAVTPWVMTTGSQFRPAPPPALTSETWTRDLNEIRDLGSKNSTKRTSEQTTVGRFWFLVGPRTYNPIVRQVAMAKDMDIVDCARVFALVTMAGTDALIAVFDAKYTYDLWRPVTAIRNADQTNNAATPRDASWLPLGDTPMHPEYPCAHCITSAAVSAVLQSVAGDEVGEISLTSPTAPGVTRKWTRLQDYSNEVSMARIYAGFHYRFSTEVGKEMGKKIGELTVATQMRRVEAAQPR
jgi:VCPO second helical-bundle domain